MHYSGILVIISPGDIPTTLPKLESLPGVEVHHCHRETGRVVVVQETESAESQETGLRRIMSLPKVLTAQLVYHFVDSEAVKAIEEMNDAFQDKK